MPGTGTEGSPISASASVVDPNYANTVGSGDTTDILATWSVTKNGQPFYPYPAGQITDYQTVIFRGSGTASFHFTPDDGGTYRLTLQAITENVNNQAGTVTDLGPVSSAGTTVVQGLPPSIDSLSVPRFA